MFLRILKIIKNLILFGLVTLGILVVFSFFQFPGNYKIFTVQSGSMEPAIHTGSLIFVKPRTDYNVGDVVTRKTEDPKVTITHRIFSKEETDGKTVFEIKGDANNGPDGEKFEKDLIIGKTFLNIPYLGYPVGYAKTQKGMLILVIIPAVIIIYDEINKLKKEIVEMWKRKKAKKEAERNEAWKSGIREEKLSYPNPQFVRRVEPQEVKKRKIV